MFRSIFTKSLRDYRVAIFGWGIGVGLLVYFYYATVLSQLAGTSGSQLQQLAQQFSFFGEVTKANTPGGYITFKIMGTLPLILGIWALLAGSRMTRGEEESAALDILLSTPQSRWSVFAQKALALAAAMGLISLLMSVLILGGMVSAKLSPDPGAALLAAFNGGITAYFFGALALLLAQFMSRGAAAGWTGALMALAFILDGTGRAVQGASGLRPYSPFYYYNRNLPLVPDFPTNWGALALLLALCVVLVGIAAPLFLRRDMGRSALADVTFGSGTRRVEKPAGAVLAQAGREVWVRDVGLQALRRQGVSMFWWIVSLAIVAGYFVIIAKTTEKQIADLLKTNPAFSQIFGGADVGTNTGFLSVIVFDYIPLVLAIFGGFMAYRWATDLDKGRLELVLSAPQSRWRVALERYAAVVGAVVVATVVICLAILICAAASGFAIDNGRVIQASLGMLPLALITASVVFAISGLLPPIAVISIMTIFLAVSFLTDLLRSVFNLPTWAVNLSIFNAYGTPVLTGLNWAAFAGMLVVAALLLGLGGWQFAHADLDRGA